jgi:hypothetical protein
MLHPVHFTKKPVYIERDVTGIQKFGGSALAKDFHQKQLQPPIHGMDNTHAKIEFQLIFGVYMRNTIGIPPYTCIRFHFSPVIMNAKAP